MDNSPKSDGSMADVAELVIGEETAHLIEVPSRCATPILIPCEKGLNTGLVGSIAPVEERLARHGELEM